ncbi:MAG: hypothetical protein ABI200_00570, partial [Gaiellales bacterium]
DGGVVQSDHRIDSATAGGVSIKDSQFTTFAKGEPSSTKILRTATTNGATKAEHYEAAYDAAGFAISIDPAPDGGREPLDAWVDQQLGPVKAHERRPAFGLMRQGSDFEHEGRTVRNPAYIGSVGVRTSVDGIDVFVEGDSVAASSTLGTSITSLRKSWAGMPKEMQGSAKTIDLLQGRSDRDRGNTVKFDSEFHAAASAGGSHMTYWMDNDPGVNTTRHEYGHLSGVDGGSPNERAWDKAMEGDQKVGVRTKLGEASEKDVRKLGDVNPLLTDELGATTYAQTHLTSNGNENDDWADSIAMFLASRENGGLVQERLADGTVRTYTFEDLYPNRARILEGYYNLAPAPKVDAPEWTDPASGSKPKPGSTSRDGRVGGTFGGVAGGAEQRAKADEAAAQQAKELAGSGAGAAR